MRPRRTASLAFPLLAACSVTPKPEPPVLDRPVAAVLVLPILDETGHAPRRELLATIAAPLRARGYCVVPPAAGAHWLAAGRFEGVEALSPELAAWARERGIEALLAIRVIHWDADWLNGLRRLDARLSYRLVATDGRGLLWERDSGSQYEFDEQAGAWAFGAHEGSGGFGFGFGGYDRESPYRSAIDVCRGINRGVATYMPKGALHP